MPNELRLRQVHLDFHTSEHVPGVGSEFDPEAFARTFRDAAVDSVTLFSRCHHGWIYHETEFPYRHPNLTCDLLPLQVRALHAADIRCPVYVTLGWDELQARLHPEWVQMDENGRRAGSPPFEPGWRTLDFASGYVDYALAQTREMAELLGDELDGVFFDIVFQSGTASPACLAKFEEYGLDPQKDQTAFKRRLIDEVCERFRAEVHAVRPGAGVFFNAGHVGPEFRGRLKSMTHLELESLPTGGWGYAHFPLVARYARTLGKPFLGMTGKFSETWGHFGSYKAPAALEYECLQALAFGGACSVGDQLPPRGAPDAATYDLIGSVYRTVRDLEPWARGFSGEAEIAVLNAEAYDEGRARQDPRNVGALRVLQEGRHQFDLVDLDTPLDGYRLLILPDDVPPHAGFDARVAAFVAGGGAVLSTGTSGLHLDGAPATDGGPGEFEPDYLVSSLAGRADTPYVTYARPRRLNPAPDAETLGATVSPYFQRSWRRFVSHAHTPPEAADGGAGIVARGRWVHFAHPFFRVYAEHAMPHHRDLLLAAIARLLPDPLVTIEGAPRTVQAHLTRQGDRRVLWLLHYIPERRGERMDVVEDGLPIGPLVVRPGFAFGSARLAPDGEALVVEDGAVRVSSRLGWAAVEFGA